MASFQKYDTKQGKKWLFKMDVGINPKTGRRMATTRRGFPSKRAAKAAAEELEYQLKRGLNGTGERITFEEVANQWIKIYGETGQVRQKTVQTRQFTIKNLYAAFGAYRIRDINYGIYQNFLLSLKNKKHFSENYIQQIHGIARMIFKYAKKHGMIYIDPSEDAILPKYQVDPEKVEQIENKYLEREELIEFLEASKHSRFKDSYNIFFILAYTGMRLGELIALDWDHVDLEQKEIYIRKTYSNISTKISTAMMTLPKTAGSIRTITIEDDVVAVLKRQQTLIKEAKLKYGWKFHDNNLVFPKVYFKNIGHPYYENFINQSFKKIFSTTNIKKKLTPHSLRHTHVSLLAEAGVDLESIMKRLGHVNDQTTTAIYMHVTKKMRRNASEKFSSLFSKKADS